MAHQVIFPKNEGTKQGSLPAIVQGSTLETITILALYKDGSSVDLSAKTITATMTDRDNSTTDVTGTLTGANGSFTWAYSAGDIGMAGRFSTIITYTDGVDSWSSEPVDFDVIANPAATAVQNPALVGISTAKDSWLTTSVAGGALGTAAYDDVGTFEPALGNPASDGLALVSTMAGVRSWAAAGGGVGDFLADGSVPMTDTLELEGIGEAGSATVLQIPVTGDDGADFNFNIGSTLFIDTYDTTFNYGFNNGGGGPSDYGKHAWYLQLEYDYNEGGNHYAEYHLNLFPAGGSGIRPFQFKYLIDGTSGTVGINTSIFKISDVNGAGAVFTINDIGETTANVNLVNIIKILPIDSTSVPGFTIGVNGGPYVLDSIVAGNQKREFRGNDWLFLNHSGTSVFQLDTLASAGAGIIRANTRVQIIAAQAQYFGLNVRGAAAHTGNLIETQNSSTAVQFAIGAAGQLKTNQAAANTATPSGATAYQLPYYNTAGTLLGYVPIYAAAWT